MNEEEYLKEAEGLEHCLSILQAHIDVLKGKQQDLTGRGLWQIFCCNIEQTTDYKIITKHQWFALTGEESIKRSNGD